MADIQALQHSRKLPSFYVEEIKHQFLMSYEAESDGKSLHEFCLPPHSCIYHVDEVGDINGFIELLKKKEYVYVEKTDGQKYFRIGYMDDHEMSIVYLLEKIYQKK